MWASPYFFWLLTFVTVLQDYFSYVSPWSSYCWSSALPSSTYSFLVFSSCQHFYFYNCVHAGKVWLHVVLFGSTSAVNLTSWTQQELADERQSIQSHSQISLMPAHVDRADFFTWTCIDAYLYILDWLETATYIFHAMLWHHWSFFLLPDRWFKTYADHDIGDGEALPNVEVGKLEKKASSKAQQRSKRQLVESDSDDDYSPGPSKVRQ